MSEQEELHIRPGEIRDTEALSKIARETFYESFIEENKAEDMALYLERNFSPEQVKEELLDAKATFFLAYIANKLAGYAKISIKGPEKIEGEVSGMEIERIYVRKEYQRRNIGQALMDKCVAQAKQHNIDVLWLGVWEHNKGAKAFYEKNGFKRYDEHEFVLGNDVQTDWLMYLKIG